MSIRITTVKSIQNRFDNNGSYLNSLVEYGETEQVIGKIEELFSKQSAIILNSYLDDKITKNQYHVIKGFYNENGFSRKEKTILIKNVHTETLEDKETKAVKRKSFKRPIKKNSVNPYAFISEVIENNDGIDTDPVLNYQIREIGSQILFNRYRQHFNNEKIYGIPRINRMVHYKNGIDDSEKILDSNYVYLYIRQDLMYNRILNEINQIRTNTENKFIDIVYDSALAYHIINMSHSLRSFEDLNIDKIMYYVTYILTYTFKYNSDKRTNWIPKMNWKYLYDKMKIKLHNSLFDGFKYEAERLANIFSFRVNKCRFPGGTSKDIKDQFHSFYSIERKKRSDIGKNHKPHKQHKQRKMYNRDLIIQMYKENKTYSQIEKEIGITRRTISNIIKEYNINISNIIK